MPATMTLLSATQANSAAVFSTFKTHTEAPRIDTKTTAVTLIRNAYPGYHVTEVEEKKVALFDFADAGKAELVHDAEDDDFNATRTWRSVGDGVEKKVNPGMLVDEWRFARFQYMWADKEYLVYYITWQDMLKSPDKMFYILCPRSSATIASGHCDATDALVLAAGKWTSQLHNEIFVFDDGRWEKSKDLYTAVHASSWSDVILDPEMKKGLIEDVQGFFDNRALYKQFAVPWKRGIILHGVPGNGKTVSIKALMAALYTRPDEIPSLYVKSFETNCNTEQFAIRSIFTMARSMAPCLLIFEDLDSLVNDDIRSYFLNEVDGLESNDGILMIGSTNHLEKLDPAISKRPSRFDRKYHFKIPEVEERRMYASYWRGKLIKNETVEYPEELAAVVADLTEGFSFAYLKELFVMALLSLVRGFKGEDFEIVDKDDAASADEHETEEITKDDGTSTEADVCTCTAKCNDCNKPLPKNNNEQQKKADEAKEADDEANTNKLVMPTVDIPEHLRDNLLLKVIKHQIRILHAEMDNSKDAEGKKGKKRLGGQAGRDYREQLRMLERANRRRC
ncbi:P-loop containing nucleoside triphosphate hydrolase protein [Setomelanomma holmii]|uniref:P-loop containing nucleoside triphosphate hydrolase protein n=1 Tax=Setomelanomma holmii TaxID=210430 RepID=A0A9P4GY50_9PLEO|nr:P-loop containing nucleoside triphosphate hydrolase protein [Setomelanomma holmii]